MWTAATTDVFDEWFQTLGDEERAEIEAKVNLLELFGRGRPQRPFYRQLIAKADILYAEHLSTLKKPTKKRGAE